MKQVVVSGGSVLLQDVPAPSIQAGTLLIRLDHSCISIGTESAGIAASGKSLVERALEQPQKVKSVIEKLRTDGPVETLRLIHDRMHLDSPTGYSAAGVVVEVGSGVLGYRPGDRVACAGAQWAHHAEYVCVPTNLVVKIPAGVGFDEASTVALGAIALQGIRRAAPTLGEVFVVVGLGLIGQLTAQMLRANGSRVIGIDLNRKRIEIAASHGLDWAVHPGDADDVEKVQQITGGVGADGVIITAASSSDEIVSTAFRMCRKKARVVMVGDVGLHLRRADIYVKELDFLVSSSYGPGRYDDRYEEGGVDYPIGYVRWTEGRNMAEYLRLLESHRVDVKSLISGVYPITAVGDAFATVSDADKPLLVLLSYGTAAAPKRKMPLRVAPAVGDRRIRIGVIGAGNFAQAVHLPNIAAMADTFELRAVGSRRSHSAATVGRRFNAVYCTTDYDELLADAEIDAVIIATRHNQHAQLALNALRAGKHVLVEKPLALNADDLAAVQQFYDGSHEGATPLLLTGFNRRFSPFARNIAAAVRDRMNPLMINYRMNAGRVPIDSWVHGPEGGGRNLGEACHIYDFFTFVTQSRAVDVQVASLTPMNEYYTSRDNFVANIKFEDGSIASLTYTSAGSAAFPKESMEIFFDGTVIELDDFRRLTIHGPRPGSTELKRQDKGQRDELAAFASAIRAGDTWPIPLWQQVQATQIAFEVERGLGE